MADEADVANDMAQKHLDVVLNAHQAQRAVSVHCVECGEYIPQARQQAIGGTDLCISCAEDMERRRG